MLFITGCASLDGKYHPRTSVKIDVERFYEPVESSFFGYENADLKVTYVPDTVDAGTGFIIENKTDKILKIVWDEVSFIDFAGVSSKVFHGGVKIAERNSSLPPTIIPPKSKVADDVLPTTSVEWNDLINNWYYTPLCGVRSYANWTIDDNDCVGKIISYYFTYELNSKKKNFWVKFKLKEKKAIAKKE